MEARVPPVRRDLDQRIEDEAAARETGMGDRQRPSADDRGTRAEDIEIEDAVAPAAAPAAAEIALDRFEQGQQRGQRQIGGDGDGRIGEAAAAGSDGCGFMYRRDRDDIPGPAAAIAATAAARTRSGRPWRRCRRWSRARRGRAGRQPSGYKGYDLPVDSHVLPVALRKDRRGGQGAVASVRRITDLEHVGQR